MSKRLIHERHRLLVLCIFLVAFAAASLTGCRESGAIGGIVGDAPVTAVIFETGTDRGEPFSGIVYREVLDYDKLLASEPTPVLVAFLDDGATSGQAIAFVETVADSYRGRLRVVRVNVAFSDNPRDVTELVELFKVTGYPCFAIADRGVRSGAVTGFDAMAQKEILDMIGRAVAQAVPR